MCIRDSTKTVYFFPLRQSTSMLCCNDDRLTKKGSPHSVNSTHNTDSVVLKEMNQYIYWLVTQLQQRYSLPRPISDHFFNFAEKSPHCSVIISIPRSIYGSSPPLNSFKLSRYFWRIKSRSFDLVSWVYVFSVNRKYLSHIHIWRCRRIERCRSRWSPYH